MTRLPSRLACTMRPHAPASTAKGSLCRLWVSTSSAVSGCEGAQADVQRQRLDGDAAAREAFVELRA